jgi:hypothetical protein
MHLPISVPDIRISAYIRHAILLHLGGTTTQSILQFPGVEAFVQKESHVRSA